MRSSSNVPPPKRFLVAALGAVTTLSASPSVSRAQTVAEANVGVAFPGQWAPPATDAKYPVWPKACSRYPDPVEKIACLEYVANDWGRLSRYATANESLAPARRGERRVVFFGDSITDAWSRPGSGGFFSGKPYVNRGIGGQTTGQMLVRFRQDVIALAPFAVVILAGTNDLAGNAGPTSDAVVQANLATMAELAREHGIKVVLASLLPVCDCVAGKDGNVVRQTVNRPPEKITAMNAWIASYARKNGHGFADYHAAVSDASGALEASLTSDGLHPNAAGYARMAPVAEKALARLAGKTAPR